MMSSAKSLPLCLSLPLEKGREEQQPICINVTLRNDDLVNRLRQKISELNKANIELKCRYNEIEFRYINEVHVNNELCDLCRANGIKFRSGLSRRERAKE